MTDTNVRNAAELLKKLHGQPVLDRDGNHEFYKPRGCVGKPGRLRVVEYVGNRKVCCEVVGWECTVERNILDVVLPPGLTHAMVAESAATMDRDAD